MFRVGQMVTHPDIDEPIRVKNSNEVCTTVERISQPMFQSMDPHKPLGTMCYPVYIVSTENLTAKEESTQLQLWVEKGK